MVFSFSFVCCLSLFGGIEFYDNPSCRTMPHQCPGGEIIFLNGFIAGPDKTHGGRSTGVGAALLLLLLHLLLIHLLLLSSSSSSSATSWAFPSPGRRCHVRRKAGLGRGGGAKGGWVGSHPIPGTLQGCGPRYLLLLATTF